MIGLLLLLGGLAVIFLALFLYERKKIGQTAKALKQLNINNQNKLSNEHLFIPSPDKQIELLVIQINQLLDDKQLIFIKSQKREKAMRQQISNISHDLRTPLTSILGYTQLLKEASLPYAERQEYLDIVEKRSRTLQTLLTGFYDLSRLDGNEYPLTLTPLDLHPILCELLTSFYEDFSSYGLEPTITLQENLPKIPSDPSAVIRIYTNLIQNVLKHGSGNLSINQFCCKNSVTTTFTNSVSSLTQEDMSSIFDRFFTADKMRTGQNTGLGLSIVKHLVEAQGHTINADLENDLFTITIFWKGL